MVLTGAGQFGCDICATVDSNRRAGTTRYATSAVSGRSKKAPVRTALSAICRWRFSPVAAAPDACSPASKKQARPHEGRNLAPIPIRLGCAAQGAARALVDFGHVRISSTYGGARCHGRPAIAAPAPPGDVALSAAGLGDRRSATANVRSCGICVTRERARSTNS